MEPAPGFEPGTSALRKHCSTAELSWLNAIPRLVYLVYFSQAMWRKYRLILMSASLIALACCVKPVEAQVKLIGAQDPSTLNSLYLDQGFLQRPSNFDMPELGLKVHFDTNDIPFAGVMAITSSAQTVTSTETGDKVFGRDFSLLWTTNAAKSPDTALATLSWADCGKRANYECAIQETLKNKIQVIKPAKVIMGSATARVHFGSTLRLVEVPGWMSQGQASWYAYKQCPCAASPDFPKGTYVRVSMVSEPTKSVIVKINDYGPDRSLFPDRAIDLDKVAFAKLISTGAGLIHVSVQPLAADDPEVIKSVQDWKAEQAAVAKAKKKIKSTKKVIKKKVVDQSEKGWNI